MEEARIVKDPSNSLEEQTIYGKNLICLIYILPHFLQAGL